MPGRRERREQGLTRDIGILERHILESNPEKFGPFWISKIDPQLYRRLSIQVRKGGKHDWSLVIEKLPLSFVDRWENASAPPQEKLSGLTRSLLFFLEEEDVRVGLKNFDPRWVEQHASLYAKIRGSIRTADGTLDWSVIIGKLPEKWRKKWRPMRGNLEYRRTAAVQRLVAFLEVRKPDTFNPYWINDNYRSLYKTLLSVARDKEGNLCWDEVVRLLPDVWRERWILLRRRTGKKKLPAAQGGVRVGNREKVREDCIGALGALFEQHDPLEFTLSWIKEKDARLYERLVDNFRDKGEVQWDYVMARLQPRWRERWVGSNLDVERKYQEALAELQSALAHGNPKRWGPFWIQRHLSWTNYCALLRFAKEGTDIRWSAVLADVDSNWHEGWRRQGGQNDIAEAQIRQEIRTLHQALSELRPDIVNPDWVKHHCPKLYKSLSKNVRTEREIDWSLVVELLDEEWRERWSDRKKVEGASQTQSFRDVVAIERIMKERKDDLCAFVSASSPEEKRIRDEICLDLIILVREGNDAALDRLIELFSMVIEDWMEKHSFMSVFKFDPESVQTVLRRCIKNFKSGSFGAFVFASLRYQSMGLRRSDDRLTLLDSLPGSDEDE